MRPCEEAGGRAETQKCQLNSWDDGSREDKKIYVKIVKKTFAATLAAGSRYWTRHANLLEGRLASPFNTSSSGGAV